MKPIVWKDAQHEHMVFECTHKEFVLQTTVIAPGEHLDYPTMISRRVSPHKEGYTARQSLCDFYELGVGARYLEEVERTVTRRDQTYILYCFFHQSGRKTKVQHFIIDGLVLTIGDEHLFTWVLSTHTRSVDVVLKAREYVCNYKGHAQDYEFYG